MSISGSHPPRRLDIGAIGWWNYDNQGDLAMLQTLEQGLAPHRIVPIDIGFRINPDELDRLNRLDYVILGGGTLLPGRPDEPFTTFDQWADQLECPLGVVGLGVDPIQEQYWPAVDALLKRARFFFVRDRTSHLLLRDHPRVQVAPDLTFAYPLRPSEGDPVDAVTAPVCGVNLRRSASLDPAPWLETMARLPVKFRGIPLSSFDVWTERALLKQLDPECPGRFDATLYQGLDLMIGTAFHAILFAVQATVPVIAIDYAPKVRNFMADIGLTHFLLSPDEHQKLPSLVDEVLTHRSEIVCDLQAIRERLHLEAQQNVETVRRQIEPRDQRHGHSGPVVTIMVIGSGDAEKDERTLASCASQTYENLEILFSTRTHNFALPSLTETFRVTCVSADTQASVGARLQQMLAQCSGEYLSWLDGGDWFARDALDCLVNRLEQERQVDMVYTDYYAMSAANLPLGYHVVAGPDKLFRRDVIGPCFLMRKALLARIGPPQVDAPLVAYDLWLRATPGSLFCPLHAPLFYSAREIKSPAFIEQERVVRRKRRRTRPAWERATWKVVDTDFGERFIVQPVVRALNLFKRLVNAEHR
jgi:hypothetical protein